MTQSTDTAFTGSNLDRYLREYVQSNNGKGTYYDLKELPGPELSGDILWAIGLSIEKRMIRGYAPTKYMQEIYYRFLNQKQ